MEYETTIRNCHDCKILGIHISDYGTLNKAIKERNTLERTWITLLDSGEALPVKDILKTLGATEIEYGRRATESSKLE